MAPDGRRLNSVQHVEVSYVQYHVVESDVHGMKPESLEQEG